MNMREPVLTSESRLQDWLAQVPSYAGEPAADARALERHVLAGERLLADLPNKPSRTPEQQQIADVIHQASRELRAGFMHRYAMWVYDVLTQRRTVRLRLNELVYLAAESFPGLVPTRAQIDQECNWRQADKECREIDQGIFIAALLRLPDVGLHLIESMLQPTVRAQELLGQFQRDGRIVLGTLTIERIDHAAHLTVHNEDCLNAEDNCLIDDMETAVDLALLDDEVRVCVLRGGKMTHAKYAGRRVFSAGINLKQLHQGKISFVDFLLRRELGYINKILRGILVDDLSRSSQPLKVEKPWVAAVDTFAIGGGAQLLLVFDRVIAGADSFFSLPAAQEGIVPGVANLRLGRATGTRMARQIILCGRKVWAHEPDAKTLFDEVVEPTEIDVAIKRNVERLDSPAVIANRRMLTLADEPIALYQAYMAEFAFEQASRLYSKDVLDKVGRA